jgi:hypothetical protein
MTEGNMKLKVLSVVVTAKKNLVAYTVTESPGPRNEEVRHL